MAWQLTQVSAAGMSEAAATTVSVTKTRSRRTRLQRLRDVMSDRQFGLCYWCREPMLPADDPDRELRCTADHIVRRADGGRTTASNIVAAHGGCNNQRHNGGMNGAKHQEGPVGFVKGTP